MNDFVKLTLGTDNAARKATPLLRACFGYFFAALAGVARHSVRSNEQHNKGQPVHWARGKSADHEECIFRHSGDIADIKAWLDRNPGHPRFDEAVDMLEHELDARAWRSLAESQEFYERYRSAPSSPSSKLPAPARSADLCCSTLGFRFCDLKKGHEGAHRDDGGFKWITEEGGMSRVVPVDYTS